MQVQVLLCAPLIHKALCTTHLERIVHGKSCEHSANPQSIALVVVLVIVIETSQVEHEDENDDEDAPQSGSAESIRKSRAAIQSKTTPYKRWYKRQKISTRW